MTHQPLPWRAETRHAIGLVAAVTAGLTLVLALFVGVALNSGPNGVRLAVAGPPAAAGQIAAELAAAAGPDAFEVDAVADPAQARTRCRSEPWTAPSSSGRPARPC